METAKIIAACVLALCIAALLALTLRQRLGKSRKAPADGNAQDCQLIDTIRVPGREEYVEDPDEEGECGDSLPLDDAAGLFDPGKTPQDKQTLIDIMRKQGFNVSSDRQ